MTYRCFGCNTYHAQVVAAGTMTYCEACAARHGLEDLKRHVPGTCVERPACAHCCHWHGDEHAYMAACTLPGQAASKVEFDFRCTGFLVKGAEV